MCIRDRSGIYWVGRKEWLSIVDTYEENAEAKRKAVGDLRCGFGESSFISLGRAPRFYEYENGVLIICDAGDLKTLFFDIHKDESDKRWALYEAGHFQRRIWRWVRLPVSREVVEFSCEGSKLASNDRPPRTITSLEVFEAINLSLGEPLDGSVIHRPFEELVASLERLI